MIFSPNFFCVYKRARFSTLAAMLLVCSSVLFSNVSANGAPGRQLPVIDLIDITFNVPEGLAEMKTEDIEALHQQMVEVHEASTSTQEAEEKLFNELLRHDEVRITIAEIIPALIENYGIDGEYKESLLGYKTTFQEDLPKTRETVEELDDYPSYDFRFTAVYMSMLFSFQSHPEFYDQLQKDMVDDDSVIGEYRKKLDKSYLKVKEARLELEGQKQEEDLKNLISALDAELASRH